MADSEFQVSITLGDSMFQASGDPALVMKALAEFRAMAESANPPKRQTPTRGTGRDNGGAGGTGSGGEPLAVFVKRKWNGQAPKATAIVMWATDNAGKTWLAPSEIEDFWRQTSGKVPANMTQVCASAVTQGWLHKEGKGQYSVTGYGREMVEKTPKSKE